jgi:hypothetical protein
MLFYLVYLACLLASIIIGFIFLKHLASRQLFLLPWYLLLVFAQELGAYIIVLQDRTYSTGYIYNIYNPVNAAFFTLFYYRIPFNRSFRNLIGALLLVFLIATIFTFCFIQSIFVYNSYISLAGGFLITLCGILFLFNYFKLDSPEEEKKWLPVLWITVGLVAFYPVVNISFALYKYLLNYQATLFGLKLYRLIPQLMSIFMYGCFIRAFYLCRKKN